MVSEMTPARAGMAGGRRRTVRELRAPRMTAIPDGAGLMSRGPRARPRPKQLQEVVRQADHGPLGAYLREAAEGKAPKAATVFDVGENGLHDRFAAPIDDFADRRPQLRAHLLARRATLVGRRRPRPGCATMPVPVRRNIGVHAPGVRRAQVRFAEES